MGVLYDFIDGVEPDAAISTEKIGSQIAEMHNLMKNYKGSLIHQGKPYFIDFYISKLHNMGYPAQKVSLFSEYGDTLWRSVEKLPKGFCHGDLHTGNMLLTSSHKYK